MWLLSLVGSTPTVPSRKVPMNRQKTWAERVGLPTAVWGEIIEGIPIVEENRATVFEEFREGIETLVKIRDENYRDKNVGAVVVGVQEGVKIPKYAVFVESGFLIDVEDDG